MDKKPFARRIVVEINTPISRDGEIGKFLVKKRILPWEQLQAQFQYHLSADRIFTSVSTGDIHRMIGLAKQRDSAYKKLSGLSEGPLVDLLSCFYIRLDPDVDPKDLIKTLSLYSAVRRAYLDPDADVAGITRDPLFQDQGHLHPAPTGIGVEAVWPDDAGRGAPGGDGEGMKFIDVERGWGLDDPELVDGEGTPRVRLIGNPKGQNSPDPYYVDHGTKTLRIILAQNNGENGLGIAPNISTANVVSIKTSDGDENRSDAILYAVSQLNFGDVLVLPLQIRNTGLPIESAPLDYSIIRAATALGITVVEAAGNGDLNLDAPVSYPNLSDWCMPQRGPFDSNAIMVGASKAEQVDGTYERYPMSNYGARIDCFAWGEKVATTRDGSYHDGTSAACAIIAGAAIVVQGIMRGKGTDGLDPVQLRNTLRSGGTQCAGDELIGVMPDLEAILTTLA
jgi:serine protease